MKTIKHKIHENGNYNSCAEKTETRPNNAYHIHLG